MGALAGGPVGAIIGALVGGAASAGAVDIVDRHDHDGIGDHVTTEADETRPVEPRSVVLPPTSGRATEYTGPGDYQRTQVSTPVNVPPVVPAGAASDSTMELYAEEMRVDKDQVQTGEVTLRKEIITEMKTIQVPVTREEVVIERRAVSDVAGSPEARFGEGTEEVLRVP